MWIYLISLTISLILTNTVLSILIPKFKKREERGNALATVNKTVFPDRRLKVLLIFLSFFCIVIGLILLFVPQLCVLMKFNWLTTNIIWNSILLIDLIIILSVLQVVYVEYNDDFILITNIFRKTKKVYYTEINKVSSNIKLFTKKGQYFMPCSLFYGVNSFKMFIEKKLSSIN